MESKISLDLIKQTDTERSMESVYIKEEPLHAIEAVIDNLQGQSPNSDDLCHTSHKSQVSSQVCFKSIVNFRTNNSICRFFLFLLSVNEGLKVKVI